MVSSALSVVIVTYESEKDIGACLRSVVSSGMSAETIVIDNASKDRTVERAFDAMSGCGDFRMVRNPTNVGFARAVNQGIALAKGDFLLVLNPDCFVEPGTIRITLDVLQTCQRAAIAGCMLLNEDGTEQAGARRYLPTPWRALVRVCQLYRLFPNHRRFQGFLMHRRTGAERSRRGGGNFRRVHAIRRGALQQVGLLDEGYFMHCEDLDWCVRFRRAGWQVMFVPAHGRFIGKAGAAVLGPSESSFTSTAA